MFVCDLSFLASYILIFNLTYIVILNASFFHLVFSTRKSIDIMIMIMNVFLSTSKSDGRELKCQRKKNLMRHIAAWKQVIIMEVDRYGQGGLAATFDLAAFRKDMIAPVQKSVNHSKTVTGMREMRKIHAILSVATRRFKMRSYSVIVYLLLACFFAVVRSLNTTINQDRWNEMPALF